MQRNPHRYQIATGYRTFYSLSLIYQPITKKRLFFPKKWRRLKKQPVFNHSLFPPKILLITGLQRRKEEILKMHGQCDYMLMIK